MKIISHRGNLNGPDPENENTLKSIFLALEKGFDIEIDTWVIDNLIYFGHDKPTTIIEEKIISQIGNNGWFHCKNLEALTLLSKFDNNINYFYHNQDDFTLTCWDFVSTPSNPGSWMHPVNGMMNEGLQSTKTNKYSKINSILFEILCAHGTCPII